MKSTVVPALCFLLICGIASEIMGAKTNRRLRPQRECIKCGPNAPCLGAQLVCDFTKNCPGGEDEADDICQHANFGASYSLGVDDPIMVRSSDNNPVKAASTNTWFSLFRFAAPPGASIFFQFIDISFTENTKRAGSSYIATGSGADPTDAAAQNGRISPGSSQTASNTHAYTTNGQLAWLLVSHRKGENIEFSVQVTTVECAPGSTPCVGSPQCISEQDRCNNLVDCLLSQEDEASCSGEPQGEPAQAVDNAELPACFPCVSDDLGCVEPQWVCDGTADCNDGEDEKDCPCDGFACTDNKCIPLGFRCDGIVDCSDDEENCTA